MKILNLYNSKTIYYDAKGYATVWVNGKNKKVHVLEWEKHNGPKPGGYIVHHKEFDKANWSLDNLQLVTHSDHLRIHAGWIMENGVWIKKPCKDCRQLLPLDKFYQRKGLTPSQRCIECSKIKWLKDAGNQGIPKRRLILPNEEGKYMCPKCLEWKIKSDFKLKNDKPTSYCKKCFNMYQNERRRKFVS